VLTDSSIGLVAAMSFSGFATSAGLSQTTSSAEKRALALAATEDAARYYHSGDLAGELPQLVRRMRELEPELEDASDAALVDALVYAAAELQGSPESR
jgi:hypothetical protein